MAIARMLKVNLMGYSDVKDRLINDLHKLGCLEISEIKKESVEKAQPSEKSKRELVSIRENISEIEKMIQDLNGAIKILEPYYSQQKLNHQLSHLEFTNEEYEYTALSFDYGMVDKVKHISEKIMELEDVKNTMLSRIQELLCWKSVKVNLQEIYGSLNKVIVLFGMIDKKLFLSFQNDIQNLALTELNIINETKEKIYFSLIMANEVQQQVLELIKLKGINLIDFHDVQDNIPKTITEYQEKVDYLIQDLKELRELMIKYAHHYTEVFVCLDYWQSIYDKAHIQQLFFHTERTFLLQGWILYKDRKKLDYLKKKYLELHIITSGPDKEEEPPVAFENNKMVTPFEFVTKLFGMPAKTDIDPTPFLTPFFIIYLAICMSDVGYGLVLLIGSYFFLRKKYISSGSKQLVTLISICSVMAIVFGILTGGFFGIDLNQLPSSLNFIKVLKNRVAFLDPLKNPIPLFLLVMGLGLIQITTGIAIRFIMQLRDRNYRTAFVESFTWLSIILGIIFALALKIKWLWAIPGLASIVIILFTSRSKSMVMKLFEGLLAFYGITGLFGDIVSHARLFALGLSSSVIALVVNVMIGVIYNLFIPIPVVGIPLLIIALLLIIIIGHGFINLFMGTLGAFVHTTRLQFVELFTKFYVSGGSEFTPFKERLDYVHLKY